MIPIGTQEQQLPAADVPQTHGWVGIVDGSLLLVRTYADGTMTAAVNDGHRFGREVVLTPEQVTA